MRIWDIPCSKLCDRHLLGEHRELHCIWTCLTTPKGSNYKKHPETLRWKHNQYGLIKRHEEQKQEMTARGWKHKSPIYLTDNSHFILTKGKKKYVNIIPEQIKILKAKKCKCKI